VSSRLINLSTIMKCDFGCEAAIAAANCSLPYCVAHWNRRYRGCGDCPRSCSSTRGDAPSNALVTRATTAASSSILSRTQLPSGFLRWASSSCFRSSMRLAMSAPVCAVAAVASESSSRQRERAEHHGRKAVADIVA
jgi:hypothetical protein